jgi:sialic acid synthase SpsE/sugar phosphate isomerase/epimerase
VVLAMSPFIVNQKTNLVDVLQSIEDNKEGIVFCVDDKLKLLGSITDGDIRRALLTSVSLEGLRAIDICNTQCKFSREYKVISNLVTPIINVNNKIIDILFPGQPTKINGLIGNKTYIIAEIGNNHQGDVNMAYDLIDRAVETGVDAIKFQHRTLQTLYSSADNDSYDLSTQYTIDLLKKVNLSKADLFLVMDYAVNKRVDVLCTPFDSVSLMDLIEYGKLSALKLASADCTNTPFLLEILETGLPLIMSTGMTLKSELQSVMDLIEPYHKNVALLHCNSTYPAPYHDLNLKFLDDLKKMSPSGIVGWSGHERGWHVVHAAIGMGAQIIEKHFTLDKSLEGTDHQVSLLPKELGQMVKEIRDIESALVYNSDRVLSQGEMMNKENLSKSLAVRSDLKKDHILTREDLTVKSPGGGISPLRLQEITGKPLLRDISKGEILTDLAITPQKKISEDFEFDVPFGIPVRFHDLHIADKLNCDFVEFHLSYSDLQFDISSLPERQLDFVIHAPELFENDHILDLVSNDNNYVKKSIDNLNRVISLTNKLIDKFSPKRQVGIVTNLGGFSIHGFKSKAERERLYKRAAEMLNALKLPINIEIWPQTMPPFPWHFGGQRFHNLFTNPEDIIAWCELTNRKICLDVSHTGLYCLVEGINPADSFKQLMRHTSHLHIADAKPPDGEGLQIGDGVLDFKRMFIDYVDTCPESTFIPEIWQGHKNEGFGFVVAFNELIKRI